MVSMSMERGGFGNVVSFAGHRVGDARGCSLLAARVRSLGGRCQRCGWCGRVGGGGPARVGVLVLDGDGRTFRREGAPVQPEPVAAVRRAVFVHFLGAEHGESRLHASPRVGVGAALVFRGRVHLVGDRAGAQNMPDECPGLCCVRTCCDVGCSAPVLRVGRLGGVRVRSAGGHARRGRAGRARWSGRPHGAAQSAAPFGPIIASFVEWPLSYLLQHVSRRLLCYPHHQETTLTRRNSSYFRARCVLRCALPCSVLAVC